MSKLFLIFNHQLTALQEKDALISLGADTIQNLPEELQVLWSSIPSNEPEIKPCLKPIETWLSSQSKTGDYVLIQGDFGACYLMVNFAFKHNLIPVYSTTERFAVEEKQANGTVRVIHHFQHEIFRKYGR
ncbi:CRISPR-associated protein Csx20 [Desulfobacterium sp. N47]|uniref:Uncharacterized protein MJ1673 n=1 Tax=uncultured Desulfobacterium sp. TaxID=201089 RepID=E1YMA1_9BACT|nr:Uncharacterized protein MJ1673 [uncultured Desulfobacterium sp.]